MKIHVQKIRFVPFRPLTMTCQRHTLLHTKRHLTSCCSLLSLYFLPAIRGRRDWVHPGSEPKKKASPTLVSEIRDTIILITSQKNRIKYSDRITALFSVLQGCRILFKDDRSVTKSSCLCPGLYGCRGICRRL